MVRKYTHADVGKIFERLDTYSVGFDKVFDTLTTANEVQSGYPPYNIITAADEFNIHVVPGGNLLVVQGVQDRGVKEPEYYHKGIAARNFTRTFALADGVKVGGAEFINGMLLITLKREIPEDQKPIEIKVKGAK